MMKRLIVLCTILIYAAALWFVPAVGELENTAVQRSVDLTSQIYRETVTCTVTNNGAELESSYRFVLEHPQHIAFFEPKVKKSGQRLPYTIKTEGEHQVAVIEFESPLKANEKAILQISIVKTHVFQPYPKEVAQNEKQQILYVGNILYPSFYPTLKTKVAFTSPNEEVTSSNQELSVSANKLTYSSTEKILPHAHKEARIHFTNNARFLVTESLVRTLEISHWGNNLAYEEFYDVIHGGAKLKGYYSRLDYDREAYRHHETAVIKQVDFELPADATDVYYRDIIGNISTSNFRSSPFETSSLLELRPRFPIFGGWRSSWYHGYNTLLSNSLKVADNGKYVLNFLFVNPYEDAVIDDFTLRVTLPEGATDIEFESEFDLHVERTTEKVQTYLDTIGRPVVVIKKKNVVNEHKVPVQITYNYATSSMLQEPLLLTAFYFILFILSMFFIRLDLSIANPERERKEKVRESFYKLVEKEGLKKKLFESLDRMSKEELSKKKQEVQDRLSKLEKEVAELKKNFNEDKYDQLNIKSQERLKRTIAAINDGKPDLVRSANKEDETKIDAILNDIYKTL